MWKFVVIILIFAASLGHSEVPPLFIQKAETVWNTFASPKASPSFNVNAGDLLVAAVITDDASITVSISDNASLTWTQQKIINIPSYSWVSIWTAQANSAGAITVTATNTGAGGRFGMNVLTFRGSSGVGASSSSNGSGAPTLNITTTQANSAIVVLNGDWSAMDGVSRSWLTNAGSLTELTYSYSAGFYTAYAGYHANSGAIGTYAVGLSAPTGQQYAIIALEVKGTQRKIKHRVLNY
ncbi:MAG: hypothetical protein ACXWRZ_14630 [Bdellovibrio sp.]